MKIKPVVKMHGGKWFLKDLIISKFPKNYQDLVYLEVYGGGGSVILNKEPSSTELYNEINRKLSFAFYCIKTYPDYIAEQLNAIPYTEDSFKWSINTQFTEDDRMGAVAEIVARRMSRGGMKSHFAWSERLRGGEPGDLHAWNTFRQSLPLICKRLENVIIKWCPAIDIIKEWSGDNTLIYADPPYLPKTRSVPKVYEHEMTEKQHCELAEVLKNTRGKVMLSGYYSPLYTKLYKGWNMELKDMPNHSSQSKNKERRIEVLWMNY